MKIAVSIPVHEAPEVVADQVRNIVQSSADTCVVLHVSANAPALRSQLAVDLSAELTAGTALVNPVGVATNLHNLLVPHLENFAFLEREGHPFEYFCLEASNDYLIRPRLDRHVVQFEFGMEWKSFAVASNVWYSADVRQDEFLRGLISRLGGSADTYHGSQAEGTFFRRELLSEPIRLIRESYADYARYPFPKEEVLLPTVVRLVHDLSRYRGVRPYVFVPWGRRPSLWKFLKTRKRRDYSVTTQDVDQLLAGSHPMCKQSDAIYGVKRVDRRIDDPVRVYIRNRMAADIGRPSK